MNQLGLAIALAAGATAATTTLAQFNPAAGQWLKDNPDHIRVMTWNIGDGLSANSAGKTANAQSQWNAIVRIIASLEPDVVLLQEVADDNGADSVSQVANTLDLFRNGGSGVTSYITAFATPGYNLPYEYILGPATDGFNRNVILSRFPITDINGDGIAAADNFSNSSDLWAPGGGGGIRGFSWAEIDLPDTTYAGDLVVGNSHLKAFSGCSEYNQRLNAAKNISYFIEHYWNGAGTAVTDPNNRISSPSSGSVLGPTTPVIWGGDWNNTPFVNGFSGCFTSLNPIDHMVQGGGATGDGPDRDGSDAMRDFAFVPGSAILGGDDNGDFINEGDESTQSGSKLDYLAWQDSIATAVNEFIFNASSTTFPLPGPAAGFPRLSLLSGIASDHRPVIVDFQLPPQATSGPPIFSTLVATPANAAFNQNITLETSVFDPDGSINGDVLFFEDSNNNNTLDPTDQQIATATPPNPSGTSAVSTTIIPSAFLTRPQFDALIGSTKTLFAQATSNTGEITVTDTTFNPVNLAPTIDTFTASPATLGYSDDTNINAAVTDPDGLITDIELIFDSNDNLNPDPTDDVIASQSAVNLPSANLAATFSPDDDLSVNDFVNRLGSGNRVFVRATDSNGETTTSALSLTFQNTPPTVSLSATPNPASPSDTITVSATVSDIDGTVSSVIIVADDGDGVAELNGEDLLIGFLFAPPFQGTVNAADLNLGTNTILAEAFDNASDSTTTSLTVEVNDCPADINGDGSITPADVTAFTTAFGNGDLVADIDGNGSLTPADVTAFVTEFSGGC